MVRILQPWSINIGKRLVKRPKLYLRDSGLFHALLSIETPEQLHASPRLGASWEGFALDCVCRILDKEDGELYFWHTHAGAEAGSFLAGGGTELGRGIQV